MFDVAEMEDFEPTARSIHAAMLSHGKSQATKGKALAIRWGDRVVRTADRFEVTSNGKIKIEFLRRAYEFRQGLDIKVSDGIVLADGTRVPVLRTWNDPEYEDVLEYEFASPDNTMAIWNVYEETNPAGTKFPAKWSGNAGFWVDVAGNQRTYHCSAGPCSPPDFEALVFRVTLIPSDLA